MISGIDIPQLFDYKSAAQVLHLSHYTLRRWVSEGRICHTKLGGRIFFTRDQLIRIIASRAVEPVAGSQ